MESKGLGRSIPSGAADCAQNDGSEAERTACSGRMGLRKKVKAGDTDLRGTDVMGKGQETQQGDTVAGTVFTVNFLLWAVRDSAL